MRAMKQRGNKQGLHFRPEGVIFNNLPIGLLVFDERTRLVNANRYIFKIFYRDSVKPDGLRFGDLFHCKYAPMSGTASECAHCMLMEAVKRVLKTGESETGLEIQGEFIINGRLTTKWFNVNLSVIQEKLKRYVMASFTDITDKHRAEHELTTLGLSDELTGLYTRRYFLKRLEELVQLNWPDAFPISVVLIDIDGFDSIVERMDEGMGEHMLRTLADVLKNYTRSTDIIGRYGDDEFVMALANTPKQDAEKILTDMNEAFKDRAKEKIGMDVTFSAGLVSAGSDIGAICDVSDYINDVEDLLLRAKKNNQHKIVSQQEVYF